VLGDVIGRGGFAIVYRARQVAVDRDVAVKIDARTVDDERSKRRFLREATAAGRISDHPHVVSLIDVGTTPENHPYLVMELCENGNIAQLLRARGAFGLADVRDLGLAMTSALAAAHDAGILHRDIKPANILIDAYGTPRLSDFGLAAVVEPGRDLSVTLEALTPAFAAPEVFNGAAPTPQADVWSLAATLYATLIGRAPRTASDGTPVTVTQLMEHLHEPLPDPQIPGAEGLMQVIGVATQIDPQRRYPNGRAFFEALSALNIPGTAQLLVRGPVASFATVVRSGPSIAPKTVRRWPVAVAAAVAGIAVGVGGTLGVLALRGQAAAVAGPGASTGTTAVSTKASTSAAPSAPALGQCWGGIVSISGYVQAQKLACTSPHSWETYASGVLLPTTASSNMSDVSADYTVTSTCTQKELKAYTTKQVTFTVDIIPPSEAAFAAGQRGFSCVATVAGAGETTGSIKA
jgi:tRNA A-37 threonylcarbamoyl transferase component Bud32